MASLASASPARSVATSSTSASTSSSRYTSQSQLARAYDYLDTNVNPRQHAAHLRSPGVEALVAFLDGTPGDDNNNTPGGDDDHRVQHEAEQHAADRHDRIQPSDGNLADIPHTVSAHAPLDQHTPPPAAHVRSHPKDRRPHDRPSSPNPSLGPSTPRQQHSPSSIRVLHPSSPAGLRLSADLFGPTAAMPVHGSPSRDPGQARQQQQHHRQGRSDQVARNKNTEDIRAARLEVDRLLQQVSSIHLFVEELRANLAGIPSSSMRSPRFPPEQGNLLHTGMSSKFFSSADPITLVASDAYGTFIAGNRADRGSSNGAAPQNVSASSDPLYYQEQQQRILDEPANSEDVLEFVRGLDTRVWQKRRGHDTRRDEDIFTRANLAYLDKRVASWEMIARSRYAG